MYKCWIGCAAELAINLSSLGILVTILPSSSSFGASPLCLQAEPLCL